MVHQRRIFREIHDILSSIFLPLRSRILLVLMIVLCAAYNSKSIAQAKSQNNHENNDEETAELISSIRTYLFQNLDSARVYLDILNRETIPKSNVWDEYLKLELIYYYYRGNLDSSIYYTNIYHDFGVEQNDINIIAYGLNKLMLFHEYNGDMKKSDQAYIQLSELVPQLSDRDELAKIYSALGARESTADRYTSALNYYLKIDSMYATEGINNRSRAMALENIGGLYGNLKDTLAVAYFEQSKQMYAAIDDEEGVNSIALSLGKHWIRMGNDDAALREFLECKDFFEAYQNEEYIASLYNGLLVIYLGKDRLKEAEEYQKKLNLLIADNKESLLFSNHRIYSGELYYHKKEYDKSIAYYLEGLYSLTDDKTMTYEGLKGITKTYEALKDYKNAYHYSELKSELKDSLNELRNYEAFQTVETQYQTKQKEEKIELLSTQNELIAQKQTTLSTIYISIITAIVLLASFLYSLYRNRKKVAQQLDLLDKMKSKFFTNISHEFRTPLTIIGGLTNQVIKSPNLDSTHISSLQTVRGNVERLTVLTNQLIDLNKIDANKLEAHFVSGDIHAYLIKYASLFMSYITSQQKELIVTIPDKDLVMDFDEDKLQSILYNLLHNAIKHTGDNGIIEIRASQNQNNFVLEVIDNGEGIDPTIVDQIFDRFYSTSEQGALGSGVGLSYVKELVQLCAGKISVSSHIGKGSAFKIIFPIEHLAKNKATLDIELPVKLTSPNSDITPTTIASHGDMHMLIVEDNDDILKYLKMLLQDDFLVTAVKNGKEAIDIIKTETIDFIVSDVMMPVMNGFELCKYVKEIADHSHIPFILITAKTAAEDRRKGQELGVDGYLTKPFDEEELLALISNLLRKREDKINWFMEVLELKSSLAEEKQIRQEDLDFIKKLQTLILENPITFGVTELSAAMAMSSKTLRSKVQTLTGRAINKYSNHIRIEKSIELLRNTDYTISQIANEVGYHDAAYYSRVFKKHYNMSPKGFKTQKDILSLNN